MAKIVGIDLGTTNSAVSIYEMGTSRTIPLKGLMTTPSVIWVNQDGEYVVGKEAKQHIAVDPDHILVSTKRDLGSDKIYHIGSETVTPTEAAMIILAYLKREATKVLKEEINDVVITVPAYFGFQEIGEVKKAAIDAGLNPIAIIPEPTAAAIRYGIDTKSRQTICVVDLGGGTFDVTILDVNFDKKTQKHIITPVNWDGDHYLGGDDFDNAIIEWMIQNGAKSFKNKLELKSIAEAAKIDLASLPETQISHPVYLPKEVILTRDKYKQLIQDKLEQIGNTIKKTINESRIDGECIDMDDINRFVLVGGSCKHPVVREYVKGVIGKDPFDALNLDTYVSEGAALFHHALITPGSGIKAGIRLPKTLGTDLITDAGKINAILLKKGTAVPCRAIQAASFGNVSVGRSAVLEGEAHLYDDNKVLDVIEVPLANTGYHHPVFTEFMVDASALLSFNTYVLNLSDDNFKEISDDLTTLNNSALGDANIIKNDDWDEFYLKYSKYIEKTSRDLKINV